MNRASGRMAPHAFRAADNLCLTPAGRAYAAAASAMVAGDVDRATSLYHRCLTIDPRHVGALHDLGVVAARQNQHDMAVARFERVLVLSPNHADAWLNMALSLCVSERHAKAVVAARRAVALKPSCANSLAALAHVLSFTPDLEAAAAACTEALSLDPASAPAYLRQAIIRRRMGDVEGSLASCDSLIALQPASAIGHVERGITLVEAGRQGEAESDFRSALAHDPANGDALMGLSRCLIETDDADLAIVELDRGIAHVKDGARLHMLRGLLHQKRGRFEDAFKGLRQAIELAPRDPIAYFNMGVLLLKAERDVLAIAFFEQAARLKPDMVAAYVQLAEAHRHLGHHSVVIALLDHAHGLAPEQLEIRWMACWARMHACAWQGYDDKIRGLMADAIAGGHTISPFMIMAFGLSNLETLLWNRAWAETYMSPSPNPLTRYDQPSERRRHERIRIGYLSADFRGHATAALVSELFRLQDRDRFELFGYNIGRSDGTDLGQDMVTALDHMVDLCFHTDREAAERIAEDGLEILVDLKGFTTDSRPAILAHRPAPIQVAYLGYPSSMGTKMIDYIVADAVVAPFEHQPFFDEAIVHLPHSYQPNDRRRPGSQADVSREAHGLPDSGFVFCCFNNNYKLTPLVFGIWMRLLAAVPESVLWLLQANNAAADNLRAAALDHGIPGERLIFAPRLAYDQHLSRLGLADLFLDTLPVNAHTSASEALWVGVPVLSCIGSHFASRVAASLLTSVGLPELITTDLASYEHEALALARDPERLQALRARLIANRSSAPLFDTPRYTRNYEAALTRMVERREVGLPPEPFAVQEDSEPWSSSETPP